MSLISTIAYYLGTPYQKVAAIPYEYPKTVEVRRVALRVQEDTTEDAIRPALIDRFAVKYISESWTSEK